MFLLTIISNLDFINGDFFRSLFDEYSNKVFGIAKGIVGNKEDAEDIVQETYIKIYLHIKNFYNLKREEIIPLIVIYTENTAKDFLRKRNRQVKITYLSYDDDGEEKEFDIPDNNSLPLDEIIISKETSVKVAKQIDSLPDEQRHAIILKYRYGMKDKEIAKVLCISETAVSSKINRAKISLRKKMEENER